MKIVYTVLICLVIGSGYSLAARRNPPSSNSKQSGEMLPASKNSTSSSSQTAKDQKTPEMKPQPTVPPKKDQKTTEMDQQVVPGITISKGFKRTSCLVSRFAVLCASSSPENGCITKSSKTKCGKQCVCSPKDCACGTSGCYCQVDGGCRCNGSK